MENIITVKPMILTDTSTNTQYTLEFNRDTVIQTNRAGFKASEAMDNIEEMLPILFYGSFLMHHPSISKRQTDKFLFEDLQGISGAVLERLIELYSVPKKTLIHSDENTPKNARMTISL